MIAVSASLLGCLLAGVVAGVLLRQDRNVAQLLSSSLLIGLGVEVQLLFVLSLLGIPWSALALGIGELLTNILLMFLGRRALSSGRFAVAVIATVSSAAVCIAPPLLALSIGIAAAIVTVTMATPRRTSPLDWRAAVIVALIAVTLIGYGLFATAAPIAENDFLFIWGLKARVFLEHQGVDWAFLTNAWNEESHPDYPLFVPLTFDVLLSGSSWNDRYVGLVYVALAAAAVMQCMELFRRRTSNGWLPALGGLAIVTFVCSPWVGLADAFVVVYGFLGFVILNEALGSESRHDAYFAAVLIGFGAQSKNEGLTLIAAGGLGLLLATRSFRQLRYLLPAICLAVPWLVIRALLGVTSYLAEGHPLQRVDARRFVEIATALPSIHWRTAVLLILVIGAMIVARLELATRTAIVVAAILQSAIYLSAFLITPKDVVWQMHTAFERLVSHIAFPLVAVVLLALIDLGARLQPDVRPAAED